MLMLKIVLVCIFFFFNDTATTEIYTLSLHDALPISGGSRRGGHQPAVRRHPLPDGDRAGRHRGTARGRARRPATADPSAAAIPSLTRPLQLDDDDAVDAAPAVERRFGGGLSDLDGLGVFRPDAGQAPPCPP